MRTFIATMMMLMAFPVTAPAAVQEQEVTYSADGTELRGHLAFDDSVEGKRPGILVVHEWWGLNDYARKRASMLAELGYTALAVDMYGEGKTAAHPEEAGSFAGELRKNLPLAKERFLAAMEQLKKHPTVDTERIAAIGYCFGGGLVLEMARAGIDLDGVVSFHGNLTTDNPARPGEVEARILVLNGAEDRFITAEQIDRFKEEMAVAGVDYRFISYPGARHSFTNPQADETGRKFDMPIAYDPEADRKSWQAMQEFLAGIFRSGKQPGE